MEMSTVIKYRTWIDRHKQFKFWGFVEGLFVSAPTGSGMTIEECLKTSQVAIGLQSKSGMNIYVGDFIKEDGEGNHPMRICFGECTFREDDWGIKPKHYGYFIEFWDGGLFAITQEGEGYSVSAKKCEIVGNIHQNPEMKHVPPTWQD